MTLPTGITAMWVNGELVWENVAATGVLPGEALLLVCAGATGCASNPVNWTLVEPYGAP